MRHFLISITGSLPYPVIKTYQEDANNWSTATSRAVKQYIKDNKGKTRRITELNINIRPLKAMARPQDKPCED